MSIGAPAGPTGQHTGRRRWFVRLGRACAVAAALTAIAAGFYLWTAESWGLSSGVYGSLVNGSLVTTTWQDVPTRNPENERTMAVWAVFIVVMALLGLVAALRGRLWILLGIAAVLCMLAVLGSMSIGAFFAPTGLLFLAAFFLLVTGLDRDGRFARVS